jgi:hypothetical protein
VIHGYRAWITDAGDDGHAYQEVAGVPPRKEPSSEPMAVKENYPRRFFDEALPGAFICPRQGQI